MQKRCGHLAPKRKPAREIDVKATGINVAASGRSLQSKPGHHMPSKLFAALVVVLLLYLGSYLVLRQLHIEVWQRDQHAYVIFPEGHGALLYYAWRPLSYVDGALTGMRFHVGPHR
jgi:hypothetical protein